jgi:hypothetical protein
LLRNIEVALLLVDASKADLLTFGIAVLLDVLLGALEDDFTLLLGRLSTLGKLRSSLLTLLLVALALLQKGLRDEDVIVSWDGPR